VKKETKKEVIEDEVDSDLEDESFVELTPAV